MKRPNGAFDNKCSKTIFEFQYDITNRIFRSNEQCVSLSENIFFAIHILYGTGCNYDYYNARLIMRMKQMMRRRAVNFLLRNENENLQLEQKLENTLNPTNINEPTDCWK